VLLGALMSGAKHGYDIAEYLEGVLGSTWSIGTSQLYSLLKRLEREGLVRSTVMPQKSRPSKRVFFITRRGREAFKAWLHRPTEHVRDMRVEFLAKLFFISKFSPGSGKELVDVQVQVLEETKRRIASARRKEEDPYAKLVCGFKLATVNAWLKWLAHQARAFVEKSGD